MNCASSCEFACADAALRLSHDELLHSSDGAITVA